MFNICENVPVFIIHSAVEKGAKSYKMTVLSGNNFDLFKNALNPAPCK